MSTNGNGTAITIGNALVPHSFHEAKEQAMALAKAEGFLPRAYLGRPAAVLAALMTGAELGIGPMQALRGIHIVEGKPTLAADLMLALAIRAGVRIQWLRSDAEVAHARFTRPGFHAHEERWTIEDAKRAGLDKKDNWRKYPTSMLRARVVSMALRAWSPDVIGPCLYVDGEIEPDAYDSSESAGLGSSAPTVTMADVPASEPASREVAEGGDELDGDEGSCGDPAAEAEEAAPATTVTRAAPQTLSECRDELDLRDWCRKYGERVVRRGRSEEVLAHAERVGVSRESVLRWLGAGRD